MATRKLLFLLCLLVFVSSCSISDREQKAEDKIVDYLKNMRKKDNYEPILFGKLDSAYTSVKDTEIYKEYNMQRGAFEAMEILRKQYPDLYSEEEIKINMEQEKYFKAICDSLELVFTPEFIGWKIQHIYRLKNKEGDLVVNNYIFYLDKNLTMITKEEQIYRNLPLKTYNQNVDFYGIVRK